ncbi:MAG: extracellular solute-binding protein [Treponema sp.]|jgi:raffinose/stachyose/melibiose transport system substrate-binding protein|nr:extracellular solute-binding protein [Treponema sp.]
MIFQQIAKDILPDKTLREGLWRAVFLTALMVLHASCTVSVEMPIEMPPEDNLREEYTLKIVTPSGHSVRALYEIAEVFSRNYPLTTAEVSVISGTVPINTFLISKFAVGDVPDILIYQGGSDIELFAQGNHLLDLSDAGFEGRFSMETEDACRYQGRLYALPLDISISGLFVQMSVLWQGAVRNNDIRIIPGTLDEFIESCVKLRRAGIEYPIVIGASSGSGAAIFLFQYMYQNLYTPNPHFYEEILRGERNWTDKEFRDMYRAYEQLRQYVNPDAARISDIEAIRRFAEGEAAYYLGLSRDIATIRRFKQNLDMVLVPSPWGNKFPKPVFAGVDTVVSASALTPYPEEVKAFLGEFTSVYGANLYSQAAGSISTVKDTSVWYDSSLGARYEIFNDGTLNQFMSRKWLLGFEDAFRRLNREWFTGRSAASILEELERIHWDMLAAGKDGL